LQPKKFELVINLKDHLGRRRTWNLQGEFTSALVARVDNSNFFRPCAVRLRACQQVRDRIDRVLGGGQTDAQQTIAAEGREALKREGKMSTALVRCDRMNLVDDHGACGRQLQRSAYRPSSPRYGG
jgi:hypothetical protein